MIDHKNRSDPTAYKIRDTGMKNMTQLESSLGHFLALKRNIRPGIKDWDTKMI